MNSMLTRAITGSVFVATLIYCSYIHWGAFIALFLLFVILGSREYLNILRKNSDFQPNITLGIAIPTFLFLSLTLGINNVIDIHLSILILPLVFSVFLIELFRKKKNPFGNIAHTLIPTIWIGLPFTLFFLSNTLIQPQFGIGKYSAQLVLVFYFTLWSNDTGAYLTGKALGKNKLFERISPNKTWEGTIGGALVAICVCYISSRYFDLLSTWKWLSVGIIIVVFGSLGDLVESLFKRSMNVKDSGTLLPGHGGVLDRFDSLLLASPFVFTFLILTEVVFK